MRRCRLQSGMRLLLLLLFELLCLLLARHLGDLLRIRRDERDVRLVVRRPARRAQPVQVLLDVPVAKQADLVPTLARPKVALGDVEVLHAKRATCAPRALALRAVPWEAERVAGAALAADQRRAAQGPSVQTA